MTILTAHPTLVPQGSTSLLIFQGPPMVAVNWSLIGNGVIDPQGDYTNEAGVAYAVFTPFNVGDEVTVTVTHGDAA